MRSPDRRRVGTGFAQRVPRRHFRLPRWRVDPAGRRPSEPSLQEEIANPLSADFMFRVRPEHDHRCAEMTATRGHGWRQQFTQRGGTPGMGRQPPSRPPKAWLASTQRSPAAASWTAFVSYGSKPSTPPSRSNAWPTQTAPPATSASATNCSGRLSCPFRRHLRSHGDGWLHWPC